MKKLFLVALIMSLVTGVTLAQTHPSKKPATSTTIKTEVKKDTVVNSTAANTGKHKMVHHKKTSNTHKKS